MASLTLADPYLHMKDQSQLLNQSPTSRQAKTPELAVNLLYSSDYAYNKITIIFVNIEILFLLKEEHWIRL